MGKRSQFWVMYNFRANFSVHPAEPEATAAVKTHVYYNSSNQTTAIIFNLEIVREMHSRLIQISYLKYWLSLPLATVIRVTSSFIISYIFYHI